MEYYTVGQSYYTNGSKTTPRVEYYNYRMTGGALIAGDRYLYDELGNITEIQESEPASGSSVRRTKVRYTYDYNNQNQLKTETRYTYSSNTDTTGTAVTSTYTYDTAGNLRSASDGTITLTYDYGDADWKDLLTKVGGTTISCDGSGNPTNWYNGAKSYSDLTWQNGRRLTQLTTGGKTSKYTYDSDGIRSTKDVNGTVHEYRTLNGKVVWEKIGEGDTAKIMVFSYDAQGRPFALKFSKNNGTSFTNYFYALNQQGDVVKIFRPVTVKDADGNVIGYTEKTYATYTYDAWGKLIGITNSAGTSIINKQTTSTSLANLNPLRYRGYYYDTETGFYYLQSRYYDPTSRRFINADSYVSTGQGFIGTNMFAYCSNTPTMYVDPTGKSIIGIIIAVVAGIGLAVGLSGCGNSNPYPNAPSDFVYYPAEARRDGYQSMPNCYGYVLGNSNFIDPGILALSSGILFLPRRESKYQPYNKDIMIASVLADGDACDRPIRVLSSPSEIREGEQLVVCKLYEGGTDYHFAMQLSDGSWADKFGNAASRWNEIDGFADTWTIKYGDDTWIFDSASIYFAFG